MFCIGKKGRCEHKAKTRHLNPALHPYHLIKMMRQLYFIFISNTITISLYKQMLTHNFQQFEVTLKFLLAID